MSQQHIPASRRGPSADQDAMQVLGLQAGTHRGDVDGAHKFWTALVAEEGRPHLRTVLDGARDALRGGRTTVTKPGMRPFRLFLILAAIFLSYQDVLGFAAAWDKSVASELTSSSSKEVHDHWGLFVLGGLAFLAAVIIPIAAFIWRSLSPLRYRTLATIAYWFVPVFSTAFVLIVTVSGGFNFLLMNALLLATWIVNYVNVKRAEDNA